MTYEPKTINTVLGPISPDALGQTLVHEHFCFAYPGWYADATIAPYDRDAALQINLKVCQTAKAAGIQTIVDATPNDTGGRDPDLYMQLAQETGINIICSTGLYTEREGASAYFASRMQYGRDISVMIADLFIKEITEGIGNTGVKAGIIKVGTGSTVSPYEQAVLKAAVAAQKATGVPIMTHTDGPTGGIEQADIFVQEGASLKRVMIGHVSNSRDINYHRSILARGTRIAFDRLGLEVITPDAINLRIITDLCKEGYVNMILLSHDTTNLWLGRPFPEDFPEETRPLFANYRIDHISKDIIPSLKAAGVTDMQIETMMVDNPKNLFLGK